MIGIGFGGATSRRYLGVNAKSFGAKGDGATDDTAAIQAAVDYALENRISIVYLPNGRYKISDTIHLNYGESGYRIINFIGDGMQLKAETYAGTLIDARGFSDRPAIVFQGVRNSSIRHMSVVGGNQSWCKDKNLGGVSNTTYDDLLESDWVDTSLHANADSDTAPYAGIACDPYSGTTPSPAYPDVIFPSFVGSPGQYGKTSSSKIKIENVQISGFVCGLVTMPSGTIDQNCDFISLDDVKINHCVYGISIGHSQFRQLNIYGNSELASNHTVLTTIKHGVKTGFVGGNWSGVGFGSTIQIFDVNTSYGGMTLSGCYGESLYRFGNLGGNSTNHHPVSVIGGQYSFALQNSGLRGVPAFTFEGNKSTLIFSGTHIGNLSSKNYVATALIAHQELNLILKDVKIRGNDKSITTVSEAIFKNISQEGVISVRNGIGIYNAAYTHRIVDSPYTVTSAFQNKSSLDKPYGRTVLLPKNANDVPFEETETNNYCASLKESGSYINTSNMTGLSISGRDVTVSVGTSEASRTYAKIDLGDIIYHNSTVYYVHARSGTEITLRAVSNYDKDGVIQNAFTLSGDCWYIHARKFATRYLYYADFTAASGTFRYYRAPDDYGLDISNELSVGDRIMMCDELVGVFRNMTEFPKITAIDTGAKTITVDKSATHTRGGVKIPFWSRTFNS